MLHPYREASKKQLSLIDCLDRDTPGRELLSLICGVNGWLDAFPLVQGSVQGSTVYILYKNMTFLVGDFWESFGFAMASIGGSWPICVFGTAQNQETVRLSAQMQTGSIELLQQSISGKSTDVLENLCFQIDCIDGEAAGHLALLLETTNWRIKIAAMQWKDADFLRAQNLVTAPGSRSFFCYAGINAQITPEDCLFSLNFAQKIMLWTTFLKERLEPLEFEWLADGLSKNFMHNRMEWELALHEAMSQLHFRMVNQEKAFELFDGTGNRLYFGADCRRAAQRALLKILFPLNG